jgi:hypothetical protein
MRALSISTTFMRSWRLIESCAWYVAFCEPESDDAPTLALTSHTGGVYYGGHKWLQDVYSGYGFDTGDRGYQICVQLKKL